VATLPPRWTASYPSHRSSRIRQRGGRNAAIGSNECLKSRWVRVAAAACEGELGACEVEPSVGDGIVERVEQVLPVCQVVEGSDCFEDPTVSRLNSFE
jgi:hypothetical protein